MHQHHASRARYFNLSTRAALSLRALTSITLAFSFFITPLAPVLAAPSTTPAGQGTSADAGTSTVPPTGDSTPAQTPSLDTSAFQGSGNTTQSDKSSTGDAANLDNTTGKQTTNPDTSTKPDKQDKKDQSGTVTALATQAPEPSKVDTNLGLKYLTPQINEENGTLTYTYPLTLPPGRNGLQPDLSLTYQSDNRDLLNTVGYGWSVSIPTIKRLNKNGLDVLFTSTDFISSIDGELVNVSGTTYQPKVDNGTFHTYTFVNNVWTVTDKAGKVYTFGTAASTRQDNPNNANQIYAWYLETVRDPNNNYIKYTYYKEAGQIYPSTIIYTGNGTTDGNLSVVFNCEARSDDLTGYATGFGVTTKYRINSIQAKVNAQVVREYTLAYAIGTNGSRSLLSSVTEKGYDDNGQATTLPATMFTYQAATKSWTQSATWSMPELFTDQNGTGLGTRLGDVNGDGLPDVVRSYDVQGTSMDVRKTYLNTGAGWQLSSWGAPAPFVYSDYAYDGGTLLFDPNGDGIGDLIQRKEASGGGWTNSYLGDGATGWTSSSTWESPVPFTDSYWQSDYGTRPGDVNGDGLDDLVVSRYGYNSDHTNHQTMKSVYFNTGRGWGVASTTWQAPQLFSDGSLDDGTRPIDINGDGLMDIVQANSATNTVYINTGAGWTQSTTWSMPAALGLTKSEKKTISGTASFYMH